MLLVSPMLVCVRPTTNYWLEGYWDTSSPPPHWWAGLETDTFRTWHLIPTIFFPQFAWTSGRWGKDVYKTFNQFIVRMSSLSPQRFVFLETVNLNMVSGQWWTLSHVNVCPDLSLKKRKANFIPVDILFTRLDSWSNQQCFLSRITTFLSHWEKDVMKWL